MEVDYAMAKKMIAILWVVALVVSCWLDAAAN